MGRAILAGPDGAPAVSYVKDVRNGLPCADLAEAMGPGAADVIMASLPGWLVVGAPDLAAELLARGARLVRHAHEMTCDLRSAPPADPEPPEGFRFIPCDRAAEEIFPAWRAAYPPDHPDRRRMDDAALRGLLAGEVIGEVLPCSLLVVDTDDAVVAGVVVTGFQGRPWVGDVFRDPGRTPSGLGGRMLAAVRARAAADGWERLGLAVTEGNPARRVYERLGFTVVRSAMTVAVPDRQRDETKDFSSRS